MNQVVLWDIEKRWCIQCGFEGSDITFVVFVSAGRELDGDSRGYRSAEEQARELTRSIRREVNKLSEQWNALIERSDAWKRKLDDTANVSTLPSFYLHRKPLTHEPHYPIWIQIFWFRQKPLAATTIDEQLDSNHRPRTCALVSMKLPHNITINHLPRTVPYRMDNPWNFKFIVQCIRCYFSDKIALQCFPAMIPRHFHGTIET